MRHVSRTGMRLPARGQRILSRANRCFLHQGNDLHLYVDDNGPTAKVRRPNPGSFKQANFYGVDVGSRRHLRSAWAPATYPEFRASEYGRGGRQVLDDTTSEGHHFIATPFANSDFSFRYQILRIRTRHTGRTGRAANTTYYDSWLNPAHSQYHIRTGYYTGGAFGGYRFMFVTRADLTVWNTLMEFADGTGGSRHADLSVVDSLHIDDLSATDRIVGCHAGGLKHGWWNAPGESGKGWLQPQNGSYWIDDAFGANTNFERACVSHYEGVRHPQARLPQSMNHRISNRSGDMATYIQGNVE